MSRATDDRTATAGATGRGPVPRVVTVLALSIFVLGTSEFVITGLLPEMAGDLGVSVSEVGYLISACAVGMIVGAPLMAVATLRLPRRTTLLAMLVVVILAHGLAAVTTSSPLLAAIRVLGSLAVLGFTAPVPGFAPAIAVGLGFIAFVAAAPLNVRVFALAGAAPTLASATNTSAFNVGNSLGPALGGLAIAAGWGLTSPPLIGVGLMVGAIGLALASRSADRRHGAPGSGASG